MHVFVTGATGTIGSAAIPKLLAAGHTVSGLARSPKSMEALTKLGVKPVQGTIYDLDVCAQAAKESDAVIHLAFDHEKAFAPGGMPEACEVDRAVIKAMADGLLESQSTHKIFLYTPGVLGTAKESDEILRLPHIPRYQSVDLVTSYASKGLRTGNIRLSAITFGPDSPHPFIAMPIPKYKELGYVTYPEDSVWPACNAADAGDLFVIVIENDKLPNPLTLHAVSEAVPVKDTATLIGKKLGLPLRPASVEELQQHFGFIGAIMGLTKASTSDWTREVTGWKPNGKKLLEQIEEWSL